MEFKARFEVIGAFTLAVIALLFGCTYWLNNTVGSSGAKLYKVEFNRPVSGLLVGGSVFFNGLRVGEVSALSLDPQNPARLEAVISVNADIGVRSDTMVGVNYQGLPGIAAISLEGGSVGAPILLSKGTELPVLRASNRAGNDWGREISSVLVKVNDILTENRQPLKDTIANLSTFTKSLGGNKQRVENILNGLERMAGGKGKKVGLIYDLLPPTDFKPLASKPTWRLVINDPTVLLALNTDKIQMRPKAGQSQPIGTARWSDNLPNLIQEKIIQSYENAGYASSVLRPLEGEESDHKLLVNIRGFHIDTSKPQPRGHVEFMAKLMNGEGKVIASRLIKSTVPAHGVDGKQASNALGIAFSQCVIELISWSAALL